MIMNPSPSLLWRIKAEARKAVLVRGAGYRKEPTTYDEIANTEGVHRRIGAEFRRRRADDGIYVEGV